MRPLCVIGVSAMHLFAHKCVCGELNVHGFWHQLDRTKDEVRKRATIRLPCAKCSVVRTRVFRLTTGRAMRHRLVSWDRLFWRIVPYLTARQFLFVGRVVMWLERRFPI